MGGHSECVVFAVVVWCGVELSFLLYSLSFPSFFFFPERSSSVLSVLFLLWLWCGVACYRHPRTNVVWLAYLSEMLLTKDTLVSPPT